MAGFECFTNDVQSFASVMQQSVFTSGAGLNSIDSDETIYDIIDRLLEVKQAGGRVFLIGNGGSSAIVSHILTDLRNVAGLCGVSLHEPAPLTCFTNDYGYEYAFSKQIEAMAHQNDFLIAISSSGRSKNILNAVSVANDMSLKVMTLSGFDHDNPLRKMGHWNYWIDSPKYGHVEIGHLFLLHHIMDHIGKRLNESS
jgi:D-sedoheptulose 7-phosphate isomerase